jgi:hypothetical protein
MEGITRRTKGESTHTCHPITVVWRIFIFIFNVLMIMCLRISVNFSTLQEKYADGFVKLFYAVIHGRITRKGEAIQDFGFGRIFSMNPTTQQLRSTARMCWGSKGVDLIKWMKEPGFAFLRKLCQSSPVPGYVGGGVYLMGGFDTYYDRVLGWA